MTEFIKKYYCLSLCKKLIILFGILGLIPFILGLIDLFINKYNLFFKINLIKHYGLIIFTFLGAIYWGIVIDFKNENNYSEKLKLILIIWSIFPSALSLVILTLEDKISIIILIFGYLLSQFVDEKLNKYMNFSSWYIFLRRYLTICVIIILSLSYLILNI